jgi:regulatory protein
VPGLRRAAEARTPSRSAFASALRRLARRDHSEHELRSALAGEGHSEEDIAAALERVKASRYLDDKTYAERYTRSRLAGRGHGRALIRHGLRVRGVKGEVVDRALKQAATDGTEKEALDAVARKYWKLHPKVEPETRMKRLWAFLMRRGFPAALVHDRLQALWPKQGAILEGLEAVQDDD